MAYTKFFAMCVLSLICLEETLSNPTKRYRYDAEFLDSEIQRIKSGRQDADPIWSPPKFEVKSKKEDGSTSEDYEGTLDSEEIEITCAQGKGWHIRGRRCVTVNCPGGPEERDFNTGECLHSYSSQQPRGRFKKPFQQWNDLNHVYRSGHRSTHFVQGTVLMRKG